MIAKYQKRPKTPAVLQFGEREVCSDTKAGKAAYLLRTFQMARRQKGLCAICNEYMMEPTFDHERGRGMPNGAGGGFRDDRIEVDGKWHNAAVHFLCNGRKGSKRYHWLNGKYVPAKGGAMHKEDGFTSFELVTAVAFVFWLVVVIVMICVACHFVAKFW